MSTKSTKRRGGPWSDAEREFIRNAYPALGPAALARKLDRSKSGVCKLIARMKQTGEIADPESTRRPEKVDGGGPPGDGPDGRQDTLGKLRWARSVLERELAEAAPSQAARIAKEYRDTVEAIARMEGESDGGTDELGQAAAAFFSKLGKASA